jgi:hypothetical protein
VASSQLDNCWATRHSSQEQPRMPQPPASNHQHCTQLQLQMQCPGRCTHACLLHAPTLCPPSGGRSRLLRVLQQHPPYLTPATAHRPPDVISTRAHSASTTCRSPPRAEGSSLVTGVRPPQYKPQDSQYAHKEEGIAAETLLSTQPTTPVAQLAHTTDGAVLASCWRAFEPRS